MAKGDQIDLLANYIMAEIPGEPKYARSRLEGVGDCAIRLLKRYRQALQAITNELGVAQPGYPAPVVNACSIALAALIGE